MRKYPYEDVLFSGSPAGGSGSQDNHEGADADADAGGRSMLDLVCKVLAIRASDNTNNANDASDANNSDGEPLLVNFIAGTIFPAVRTPMITARLEAEARRRGVTPFV